LYTRKFCGFSEFQGLINTSGQIGGPIGLAVLLTIANIETPHLTGQVVQTAMTMVTGFGYAFLGAALLAGIGIIFAALLKQERHRQARVVAGTVNQS
jgi:hypothetical protein